MVAASPPASALAAAPAAAPPATAPSQARLDEYAVALSALLARHQTYPRLAALRGWQGEVRIRLRLARKGNLLGAEVVQSSGHEVLDRQALDLVLSTPLPPPPTGSAEELHIEIPIHYRLGAAISG